MSHLKGRGQLPPVAAVGTPGRSGTAARVATCVRRPCGRVLRCLLRRLMRRLIRCCGAGAGAGGFARQLMRDWAGAAAVWEDKGKPTYQGAV